MKRDPGVLRHSSHHCSMVRGSVILHAFYPKTRPCQNTICEPLTWAYSSRSKQGIPSPVHGHIGGHSGHIPFLAKGEKTDYRIGNPARILSLAISLAQNTSLTLLSWLQERKYPVDQVLSERQAVPREHPFGQGRQCQTTLETTGGPNPRGTVSRAQCGKGEV
jgi:hypothetical protein